MHFDTDILFYIDSKQYPVGRICFFTESEKCTYGSGASIRIALAILGVQSAGFALIYGIGKCMLMYSWNLLNERFRDGFLIYSNIFTECTTRKWRII